MIKNDMTAFHFLCLPISLPTYPYVYLSLLTTIPTEKTRAKFIQKDLEISYNYTYNTLNA